MKIAFLTAGGIAPCLSSSIGALIHYYNGLAPDSEMIGYLNGYQGLLQGKSYNFPKMVRDRCEIFYGFGGSAIGNSRVKLTNVEDCTKRGLVKDGEDPLEVAAKQLAMDGVDILHTIGGDDTNTTAADLETYLRENGYELTVVGMPKTIDNDVFPIQQTLGAWTASEQSAVFFHNVANENTTSTRQLIIHELMGRNCGWLTAHSAWDYRIGLQEYDWLPEALLAHSRWDIDAIWIPEMALDFDAEVERLSKEMDDHDSLNIFLSEGAGVDAIVRQLESEGTGVPRDAFGHVRLDEINVGQWFGRRLKERVGAEKVLVQKSGYFARSAAPNERDLELIQQSAKLAAEEALNGESGVSGLDEDNGGRLSIIDFSRIKGHKPFEITTEWFNEMLQSIGQPNGGPAPPQQEGTD